jgi:hypothetical protein
VPCTWAAPANGGTVVLDPDGDVARVEVDATAVVVGGAAVVVGGAAVVVGGAAVEVDGAAVVVGGAPAPPGDAGEPAAPAVGTVATPAPDEPPEPVCARATAPADNASATADPSTSAPRARRRPRTSTVASWPFTPNRLGFVTSSIVTLRVRKCLPWRYRMPVSHNTSTRTAAPGASVTPLGEVLQPGAVTE